MTKPHDKMTNVTNYTCLVERLDTLGLSELNKIPSNVYYKADILLKFLNDNYLKHSDLSVFHDTALQLTYDDCEHHIEILLHDDTNVMIYRNDGNRNEYMELGSDDINVIISYFKLLLN